WPHLVLRGGHLVAHVRRGSAPDPDVATPAMPVALAIDAPAPAPVQAVDDMPEAAEPVVPDGGPPPGVPPMPLSFEPSAPVADFHAGPEDGNLRLVLARWAKSAG